MVKQVTASFDPALTARVVSCMPLFYGAGPAPALDRPIHVRAGSSLARIGERFAVVQDDANFIALIDPAGRAVDAVLLPPGADGRRQFDDARGNKHLKLDLEASAVVPGDAGERGESDNLLIAFGSGSSPHRERIVAVGGWADGSPKVEVYDASTLYRALRAAADFAGSDMNIEGAVFVDGSIRLFGRGNGAPRDGLLPLDATCDLDWPALRAYLRSPRTVPPPLPANIVQYQLGAVAGLRLGFTDAAVGPDVLIYSAAAEDSPDATRDGPVAGSALGVFDAPGSLRWTALCGRDGHPFPGKVEGLLLALRGPAMYERPLRAYVVVDRDDPRSPTELCEVELAGSWHPRQ